MVHTQTGNALEDSQNLFAAPEGDGHHGRRAKLVTTGTNGDDVRGDAVEFHHQDTNEVCAFRHIIRDPQELLNGQAVTHFLEEGSHIVHTSAQRNALGPRAVFHGLFDTGVKVARVNASFANGFAIQLKDQAKNAVG